MIGVLLFVPIQRGVMAVHILLSMHLQNLSRDGTKGNNRMER